MKAEKYYFVSGQDPIKVLVVDEAVQIAETLLPDVVLMDWKMPNMDGLEATKRIKDFQPEIGVVLLTIHNTDKLKQRAREAGVDEFVAKGIDADLLIESIRKVHRQTLTQKK